MTAPTPTVDDSMAYGNAAHAAPGSLNLREQRSWATWQLALCALVAAVVGMMIGYSGKRPSKASGASAPLVNLGGLKGGSGSTPSTAAHLSTTSVPTYETTPTSAATAATQPAAAGPAVILLPNLNGKGSGQTASFAVGATWQIGWVFDCVLAPGGSGPFNVVVVTDPGGASTPALQQSGRRTSGITPRTGAGRFHLAITTDPACQWAVKVTGPPPTA